MCAKVERKSIEKVKLEIENEKKISDASEIDMLKTIDQLQTTLSEMA